MPRQRAPRYDALHVVLTLAPVLVAPPEGSHGVKVITQSYQCGTQCWLTLVRTRYTADCYDVMEAFKAEGAYSAQFLHWVEV